MRQYEAMFLLDSTFASDFSAAQGEIERIMNRAEAEIIIAQKWDERKLAFEIKRHKRGCYVLVYFRADPSRITGIEHDCRLSEHVLRVLILDANELSRSHIERVVSEAPASGRGDHGADDDRGDDRNDDRDSRRDRRREPVGAGASDDDSSKSENRG